MITMFDSAYQPELQDENSYEMLCGMGYIHR